jgi:hypothetical protein
VGFREERELEIDKKERSGSIGKVRSAITTELTTIQNITQKHPGLSPEQVSMALCYLLKRKYVEREQVDRQTGFGRKKVWAYRLQSKVIPPTLVTGLSPS